MYVRQSLPAPLSAGLIRVAALGILREIAIDCGGGWVGASALQNALVVRGEGPPSAGGDGNGNGNGDRACRGMGVLVRGREQEPARVHAALRARAAQQQDEEQILLLQLVLRTVVTDGSADMSDHDQLFVLLDLFSHHNFEALGCV